MAPNLPQIRVSDIDLLGDWGFEGVKAFGDSIPGYRPSATFLTTLRSNLHLSACSYESPYSSLVSTPTASAFSSPSLLANPTPSHLSISTTAVQFSDFPDPEPLSSPITVIATSANTNDRAEALHLIGNSVAEQRQLAAKALVLHPYSVTFIVLLTAILARYCSLPLLLVISTSLIVFALASLYWLTWEYATLSAEIDSKWLESPQKTHSGDNGHPNAVSMKRHTKCEDPVVLVSRLGDQVIGTIVFRVVKRERKGYVRAWTVESPHRGKGIGGSLLHEAVRIAWGKGARCMEFESGHANSHHALPALFNGSFDEREVRAKSLLIELVAEHRREKSSR